MNASGTILVSGVIDGDNGKDGVSYLIRTSPASIVIPSDAASVTVPSLSGSFFKREADGTEEELFTAFGLWRRDKNGNHTRMSRAPDVSGFLYDVSTIVTSDTEAFVVCLQRELTNDPTVYYERVEIPVHKQGDTGGDGKNAAEVILSPSVVTFKGDDSRYVYDTQSYEVQLMMKQDGKACTVGSVTIGSKPTGVAITRSGTKLTVRNSSSDYADIEGAAVVTVTGTCDNVTYTATGVLNTAVSMAGENGNDAPYQVLTYRRYDSRNSNASTGAPTGSSDNSGWLSTAPAATLQYPYVWQRTQSYSGDGTLTGTSYVCLTGLQGMTGRMFYYAGEWNPATQYVRSNERVPLVFLTSTVWNPALECYGSYWYLNNADTAQGDTATDKPGDTTGNKWTQASGFGLVITQGLFAPFAKLGGFVVSGDFFFSQYGTLVYNDSGTVTEYNASEWDGTHTEKAYIHFDSADPMADTPPASGKYKFRPMKCIDAVTGEEWMAGGKVHVGADGSVTMQNATIRGSLMSHKVRYITFGSGKEADLFDNTTTPWSVTEDIVIFQHTGEASTATYSLNMMPARQCLGTSVRVFNVGSGNSQPKLFVTGEDEVLLGASADAGVGNIPANMFYDPSTQTALSAIALDDYAMIELTAVRGPWYGDTRVTNNQHNIWWMITNAIKKVQNT